MYAYVYVCVCVCVCVCEFVRAHTNVCVVLTKVVFCLCMGTTGRLVFVCINQTWICVFVY
jgi:hypothetical protein